MGLLLGISLIVVWALLPGISGSIKRVRNEKNRIFSVIAYVKMVVYGIIAVFFIMMACGALSYGNFF